jgi:hypothetical protein
MKGEYFAAALLLESRDFAGKDQEAVGHVVPDGRVEVPVAETTEGKRQSDVSRACSSMGCERAAGCGLTEFQ